VPWCVVSIGPPPPLPHETLRDLLLLLASYTAAAPVTRSELFRSVYPWCFFFDRV
jgi:hypothetical protein